MNARAMLRTYDGRNLALGTRPFEVALRQKDGEFEEMESNWR